MRLLLFDIDGTLLDCGRQVRPLFAAALEDVFGTSGRLDGYDFAGKPDPRIVLDVMTAEGFSAEAVIAELPRVRDNYLTRLAAGLDRERMRLLPGVREMLERLSGRVAIGLLTGNWEMGARLKLDRFELNGFFPVGAFGEDGADRSDFPPRALERAGRHYGEQFRAEDALIIGDSLLDVACARAHGLRALAVATGRTSASALAAAGADWVVADLHAAPQCHSIFA
jgi:phosphoglycolate phosphatase-like HAD superfamily hydrolase